MYVFISIPEEVDVLCLPKTDAGDKTRCCIASEILKYIGKKKNERKKQEKNYNGIKSIKLAFKAMI